MLGFLYDDKKLNSCDIGLGLIISELIVKRFGGKVSFVSIPDEGSTFTFNFELYSEQELLAQNQAPSPSRFCLNSSELYFLWEPKKL